jgi:Domain of unknown function (DU1801)
MSVAEFLRTLPADRAAQIRKVRDVVRRNLPKGYDETIRKGYIAYEIPLKRFADTYNGQPMMLAALASPRSYLTLHLMPVYGSKVLEKKLRDGFKAAGKKLDIGKACIHFQKADDLALDVIGEIIAAMTLDKWVAVMESARRSRSR